MTSTPLKPDSLHDWLMTPVGQYLLQWEQQQMDAQLVDVFGFHAVQLGWAELDALRSNRMPHRWLALTHATGNWQANAALVTDSVALPFSDASLDLVVLPHTLELSRDPHATLREVERVLVPEGRVVICGFNPASLWGLRRQVALGLPKRHEMIGLWRLRDWLQLLSFEVTSQHMGSYRPALKSLRWLQRMAWMDAAGSRWWPIFGASYCVVATKRVRGMRLLEPVWKRPSSRAARAVTTASKGMK
jgi:SAM-dependent methyltransferase